MHSQGVHGVSRGRGVTDAWSCRVLPPLKKHKFNRKLWTGNGFLPQCCQLPCKPAPSDEMGAWGKEPSPPSDARPGGMLCFSCFSTAKCQGSSPLSRLTGSRGSRTWNRPMRCAQPVPLSLAAPMLSCAPTMVPHHLPKVNSVGEWLELPLRFADTGATCEVRGKVLPPATQQECEHRIFPASHRFR